MLFIRDIGNGKELLIAERIKKDDPLRLGQYVIPGGGLEEDENYIQAAMREVKEETGINTEYDRILSFLTYLDSGKSYVGKLISLNPIDPHQKPKEKKNLHQYAKYC